MYNKYFGLEESPFSIAPDPRYLYMSEQHREALAHLLYGFNSEGGFVLLTGDIGTGKTTICRCLLEQIPQDSSIAFIFNPKLTVEELLATICDEFGISYPGGTSSVKIFVDLINSYLLKAHGEGKRAVLIIDEAQNLSTDVLEQLRLLTNLETNQHKLLQIILLGQPELRIKLSEPELLQLSQRIIARFHLGPLSKKDVPAYVKHRLTVAGIQKDLFPSSTLNRLYHFTKGIPRLINVICDRALLGAYAQGEDSVRQATLLKAAREVLGSANSLAHSRYSSAAAWASVLLILIVFGITIASTYSRNGSVQPATELAADPALSESFSGTGPDWTDQGDNTKSRENAFAELFKQWEIMDNAGSNNDVCSRALSHGLRCLDGFRSLSSLRSLNRPAVLQLYDDEGKEFYATLLELNKEKATLANGPRTHEVPLQDIESRWLGEHTLFWRPPPDYNGIMDIGHTGSVVQWLDRQLSVIQNRQMQKEPSPVYNEELATAVRKFQLSEGIIPDGKVGPQTLIHINSYMNEKVPTIFAQVKKN